MRISELSRHSGRSVATIKYYLREGLLPPGRSTAANQAAYGDDHLHRLRLITALVHVGGLPIATVKAVLEAVDDRALALHDVLGVAHDALSTRDRPAGDPGPEAEAAVDGFFGGLGWRVRPGAPGRRALAEALESLRRLGWEVGPEVFEPYARAADDLAAWELDRTPVGVPRDRTVEVAVVGTVVFEKALVALRWLAQEHHSAGRFGEAGAPR